jgi:hypothetical protein
VSFAKVRFALRGVDFPATSAARVEFERQLARDVSSALRATARASDVGVDVISLVRKPRSGRIVAVVRVVSSLPNPPASALVAALRAQLADSYSPLRWGTLTKYIVDGSFGSEVHDAKPVAAPKPVTRLDEAREQRTTLRDLRDSFSRDPGFVMTARDMKRAAAHYRHELAVLQKLGTCCAAQTRARAWAGG